MTDLVQLTYWDETTQTEKDCYPVVPGQATRNIGEIVSSTLPLTDAGLHLLDGTLLPYGIYKEFIDYIADLYAENPNANYFCTESQWQASVTQYGVCGKFVYDSTNNTVRLPKITGFVEGTTDLTALGDLVQAGLPNITGQADGFGRDTGVVTSGAFSTTSSSSGACSSTGYGYNGLNLNASRSSSIYGNSTTVQPQTIKVLYYIVIATSTKTDIQVDIDEIATDLNGKADTDLSNVPTSKGILSESYVNGTSWYRVYSDGWKEQGGQTTIASQGANTSKTTTVTLLKNFSNTSYYVAPIVFYTDGGNTIGLRNHHMNRATNHIEIGTYSTTSINGSYKVGWYACGY